MKIPGNVKTLPILFGKYRIRCPLWTYIASEVMDMSYRVEYGSVDQYLPPHNKRSGTVLIMTAIILAVFLSTVNHFWAEGAFVLEKVFSSERFLETGRVLDDLADQLRNGQPVWEVISTFCADIVRQGLEYAV